MQPTPVFRKKVPDFAHTNAVMFKEVNKITNGFFGNSPPQVFIGSKLKYPNVNMGILSPPDKVDESWIYSAEHFWAEQNFDIKTIMQLRSSLINSRFKTRVDQARSMSTKFVELSQEIGMAAKPVDIEIELKKKIKISFDTDKVTMPMGPRAPLKKVRITENTKVDTKVDKVVSDTDLKANDAIRYLYKNKFDEHTLSKILSIGVLGLKKGRKLVPTKWSITAVQDMLGKEVIKQIKQFEPISDYQVYFGGYLGNYFLVLTFPDVWSFELFEMYMPGSSWNFSGALEAATNLEWYDGLKGYPIATAGGYFTNRLPVVNKLKELKKQASVLVLRFETLSYWASLGVWVVLESMKKTMQSTPSTFESKDAMLDFARNYIKKTLAFDIDPFLKKSKLLEKVKSQSRLQQFF
tara:strand:+ start:40925 stop:42148 length:1224 start_codon:yes stop_codon:yes gene_type:complete